MSLGIVGNTIGFGSTLGVTQPPVGAIVAWAKSFTGVPQTLPSGWVECDGSVLSLDGSPLDGETIPDLNAASGTARFLMGGTTSGTEAGVTTHTHAMPTTYTVPWSQSGTCFLGEQLINMSDGTKKPIIDINLNDKVSVWDGLKIITAKVNTIQIKLHSNLYNLELSDGKVIKPTGNHPFMAKAKGWVTIDGHTPNHAGGKGFLKVGDYVLNSRKNDWIKIVKITAIEGEYTTYNFIDMECGTIIADDIVTHNSAGDRLVVNSAVSTDSANAVPPHYEVVWIMRVI